MDTTTTGRIRFHTDALPERDRFPAFCEGVYRHVVGADIEQLGTAPFRGALNARRIGAVSVLDISLSAAEISRRTKHIGDGNDDIVLQYWSGGAGAFTQGEQDVRVGSNTGLIIDNAKPAAIRTASASRFLALTIPRDRVGAAACGMIRTAGSALPPSAASHLLFGYLQAIKPGDLDDERVAQLVSDHLVDLAALALDGDASAFAERAGGRAANRVAVLCAIERGSDDPALSVATVAQALGITPRYVHLLLEETGRSFSHHVLARRLECAAAQLRDPWSRGRKIADIATAAGFTDLSHFNRAFRRHFGRSPRDMRQAAIETVADRG